MSPKLELKLSTWKKIWMLPTQGCFERTTILLISKTKRMKKTWLLFDDTAACPTMLPSIKHLSCARPGQIQSLSCFFVFCALLLLQAFPLGSDPPILGVWAPSANDQLLRHSWVENFSNANRNKVRTKDIQSRSDNFVWKCHAINTFYKGCWMYTRASISLLRTICTSMHQNHTSERTLFRFIALCLEWRSKVRGRIASLSAEMRTISLLFSLERLDMERRGPESISENLPPFCPCRECNALQNVIPSTGMQNLLCKTNSNHKKLCESYSPWPVLFL